MKIAKWKDGTETVRKTHTRDYKYAYRYSTGETWIVGFSTSLSGAKNAANTATKRGISKPRHNTIDSLRWWNDYVQSEEYAKSIELQKEARATIEIVEVF